MASSSYENITHAKMIQEELDTLKASVEAGAGGDGIPPSIINAKGDLIAGTASDIPAIIPVGSDGQVLSTDSDSPTGLKWIPVPAVIKLWSPETSSYITITGGTIFLGGTSDPTTQLGDIWIEST